MAARRSKVLPPDRIQCNDQLQALQACVKAWGLAALCAHFVWILTKVPIPGLRNLERSRLVPFIWNRIQTDLYSKLGRNNLVVKGRQAGLTTFMMLVRGLLPIILEPGKTALLLSQNGAYAQKHFAMARRAVRYFGAIDPTNDDANDVCLAYRRNLLHTAYSNRRELVFDMLDSSFLVESAEVEEAGQGVTVHHLLCSEVARWPGDPKETLSNARGAVVVDGTVDQESTANGMAGYFYEQVLRCINTPEDAENVLHYYDWFWSEEYQLELSPKQAAELEADLAEDEIKLAQRMYRELRAAA